MKFNDQTTKKIYSGRSAHPSWKEWCALNLQPQGKDIADIGCGGGIYSQAFSELGAQSVVGIDSSEQYIAENKQLAVSDNLSFKVGSAANTGLSNDSVDLVFERALIHHLSPEQQLENLNELSRVLRSSGVIAIQDRTFEDVVSDDPKHWIRSTLLSSFPRLFAFEEARRPSKSAYLKLMKEAGFINAEALSYSEIRKTYSDFEELEKEILSRKGKSILFQLSDEELHEYCASLKKVSQGKALQEVDQWNIWLAKLP